MWIASQRTKGGEHWRLQPPQESSKMLYSSLGLIGYLNNEVLVVEVQKFYSCSIYLLLSAVVTE